MPQASHGTPGNAKVSDTIIGCSRLGVVGGLGWPRCNLLCWGCRQRVGRGDAHWCARGVRDRRGRRGGGWAVAWANGWPGLGLWRGVVDGAWGVRAGWRVGVLMEGLGFVGWGLDGYGL
jgi:hypothetical protein